MAFFSKSAIAYVAYRNIFSMSLLLLLSLPSEEWTYIDRIWMKFNQNWMIFFISYAVNRRQWTHTFTKQFANRFVFVTFQSNDDKPNGGNKVSSSILHKFKMISFWWFFFLGCLFTRNPLGNNLFAWIKLWSEVMDLKWWVKSLSMWDNFVLSFIWAGLIEHIHKINSAKVVMIHQTRLWIHRGDTPKLWLKSSWMFSQHQLYFSDIILPHISTPKSHIR